MFEIKTKYDNVKVFAETIGDEAISQITEMANSPLGENAHIRIMPDAHAGAGCVIGTTMKITDKVCANLGGKRTSKRNKVGFIRNGKGGV